MRVRSTTTGGYDTENWFRGYYPGGTQFFQVASYSGSVKEKRIEDRITPGYDSIRKCGGVLPWNDVIIEETVNELKAVNLHWEKTPSGDYANGPYVFGTPLPYTAPDLNESLGTAVCTAAKAEALAPTWDVLTFMAEAKQAHEHIAGCLRGVGNLAEIVAYRAKRAYMLSRHSNRGRVQAVRELFDLFAEKWLEARFAWRPLMYDASSAYEALLHSSKKGELVFGKSSQSESLNDTTVWLDTGDPERDVLWTRQVSGTRRYTGSAIGKIVLPALHTYGFNPAVTFVEKTPWTFILDYFVNLGDVVAASTGAFSGVALLQNGFSYRDEVTVEWNVEWIYGKNPGIDGGGGGLVRKLKINRYQRTGPYDTGLVFNPRLSIPKYIDMAALAYGITQRVWKILRQ